jgi:Uma2 family endonuclease
MSQTVTKSLSFEEFIDFEDSDELNEYELVDGRLVLMPEPSDLHEEILEFLSFMFELQYRRLKLSYSIRKRNALMIEGSKGRRPDIAVIERPEQRRDDRRPGIRTKPLMIVEIASGNWSNDLIDKQEEYEALNIQEYWIVDCEGQIPAKYCLRGKCKKVIVLTLESGLYRKAEYIEGESIPCQTFPELHLTVDQVLAAEE